MLIIYFHSLKIGLSIWFEVTGRRLLKYSLIVDSLVLSKSFSFQVGKLGFVSQFNYSLDGKHSVYHCSLFYKLSLCGVHVFLIIIDIAFL